MPSFSKAEKPIWKKEDELKQLKSKLSALDRKIQL